jgi:membrane protein CcdC involved in cytochrome C biogenesis
LSLSQKDILYTTFKKKKAKIKPCIKKGTALKTVLNYLKNLNKLIKYIFTSFIQTANLRDSGLFLVLLYEMIRPLQVRPGAKLIDMSPDILLSVKYLAIISTHCLLINLGPKLASK